jgi:hypothetical protein
MRNHSRYLKRHVVSATDFSPPLLAAPTTLDAIKDCAFR